MTETDQVIVRIGRIVEREREDQLGKRFARRLVNEGVTWGAAMAHTTRLVTGLLAAYREEIELTPPRRLSVGREYEDLHVIGTPPGAKPLRVFVNGVGFVREEQTTPFVDSIKAADPDFFRPPDDRGPRASHPVPGIGPTPPTAASDYHAAGTEDECVVCRAMAAQFDELKLQARRDREEAERLRAVGLKLEEQVRTLRRQKLDAENERDRADDDRKVAEKNGEIIRDDRLKLVAAIKKHHEQKADDRCWMDDDELYKAAGLPYVDRSVGDRFAMLQNCARFVERRCSIGAEIDKDGKLVNPPWPSYVELEARLAEITKRVDDSAAVMEICARSWRADGHEAQSGRLMQLRARLLREEK